MPFQRTPRRAAVGILVLVAIAGISALVYSPWHKHSRVSPLNCEFRQFEQGACSTAEPAPPVIQLVTIDIGSTPASEARSVTIETGGAVSLRAPPPIA